MSKKLSGFTLDKHDEAGLFLQYVRDGLQKLLIDHGRSYGIANLQGKVIQGILDEVDTLRSRLDNCVHKENPDEKGLDLIYYRHEK